MIHVLTTKTFENQSKKQKQTSKHLRMIAREEVSAYKIR